MVDEHAWVHGLMFLIVGGVSAFADDATIAYLCPVKVLLKGINLRRRRFGNGFMLAGLIIMILGVLP